jgi:hypothetical protein
MDNNNNLQITTCDYISLNPLYTTINCIIASYAGKIKSRSEPIDEYALQYNLYNIPKDELDQITIICPETKSPCFDNYYTKNYWIKHNNLVVYQKYEGANLHYSYDQWLQGYLKNPDFDYYIIIEDDYAFSKTANLSNLLSLYKEIFPDNIGYLCSLAEDSPPHSYHAAISNGIISKETFQKINTESTLLQQYYDIPGHPQATFSKLFLNNNIPIKDFKDYYNVYFYDSYAKNIRTYSSGLKDLFLPIQMVYNTTFISHIPKIQPLVYMNIKHDSVLDVDYKHYLTMVENYRDIVIFFKTYTIDYNLPKSAWETCEFKEYFNKFFLLRVQNMYDTLYNSNNANIIHLFISSNDIFLEKQFSLAFLQYNLIQRVTTMFSESVYYSDCFIPRISPKMDVTNLTSKTLSSVEILSEYYVSHNSVKYHIKDIPNSLRKQVLGYFKNVYDYSDCPIINKCQAIFFIPNIIHIEKNDTLRNVFSSEERFNQLLCQVKSIQDNIKDIYVKIYILELSQPSLRHLLILQNIGVDGVILFNKDPQALSYAHDANKNKSEVYLIQKMIEKIDKENFFGHIVKFGGRYVLNKHFNKELFFQDKPVFRVIPKLYDNTSVAESILYSIPYDYIDKYYKILIKMENVLNNVWTDVEHLLYEELKNEIIDIKTLGVSGHYALGQYNQC